MHFQKFSFTKWLFWLLSNTAFSSTSSWNSLNYKHISKIYMYTYIYVPTGKNIESNKSYFSYSVESCLNTLYIPLAIVDKLKTSHNIILSKICVYNFISCKSIPCSVVKGSKTSGRLCLIILYYSFVAIHVHIFCIGYAIVLFLFWILLFRFFRDAHRSRFRDLQTAINKPRRNPAAARHCNTTAAHIVIILAHSSNSHREE